MGKKTKKRWKKIGRIHDKIIPSSPDFGEGVEKKHKVSGLIYSTLLVLGFVLRWKFEKKKQLVSLIGVDMMFISYVFMRTLQKLVMIRNISDGPPMLRYS